jgi:hypothetical protein
MVKYREKLLQCLIDDLDKPQFSVHMDYLIGGHDIRLYLEEGFKAFRELISLSEDNGWLDDFTPIFRLYMKDVEKIEKNPDVSLLRSAKQLIKNLNKSTPPEVFLVKKVKSASVSGGGWHSHRYDKFESHSYTLANELFYGLFGFPDESIGKYIHISYECIRFNECYLIDHTADYDTRFIDIEYNRGNAKPTGGTGQFTLLDERDLDFYRKYTAKHGD